MKTGKMEGIYKSPVKIPTPKSSGYPNDIKNTQTVKIKGTGAATKGTHFSGRVA